MAHGDPMVAGIQVDYQVFDRYHLEEPYPPGGIRIFVFYGGQGCRFAFHRRIERLLAAGEPVIDITIGSQRIAFDGIHAVLFCKVGDIGDDIPVSHVLGNIHMGNCLQGLPRRHTPCRSQSQRQKQQ